MVAIAGSSDERAREFGNSIGVNRTTGNYQELLEDSTHRRRACSDAQRAALPDLPRGLEAGKHVLCEKPFTLTVQEARELVDLAARTRLANCIQHNLRYYPVVQQIRRMIEAGDLGEILIVQGTYSQDWLLYDTDWNWRVDAKRQRCVARHGRHRIALDGHDPACDRSRGSRTLCADLATFHPTRKRPKGSVETFAGKTIAAWRLRNRSDRHRRFWRRCCCDWAIARAEHSPSARCRLAGRTCSPSTSTEPRRASHGTRSGPTNCGSANAIARTRSS